MSELEKAVITGATSGIGFALAQALAQSGRQVLAIGRNPENLAKLNEAEDIETLAADIRDSEAVLPEIKKFAPDILVNNAGVGHGIDGLDNLPLHLIQEAVDINVTTPIKLTAAVMEEMRVQARAYCEYWLYCGVAYAIFGALWSNKIGYSSV